MHTDSQHLELLRDALADSVDGVTLTIALEVAIAMLRSSITAKVMPSGLELLPSDLAVHERCVELLCEELWLRS